MQNQIRAIRALQKHARRARRTSPVFIVGEPRSGTSIVYRSLLLHPRFATHRLDLTESFAPQALLAGPELDEIDAGRLEAFLFSDRESFTTFADAIASLAGWRRFAFRWVPPRRRTAAFHRIALNTLALRAYIDIAAQVRGCRRLVEKTPSSLIHVDGLLTAFPRAKILVVLRHPIDAFASYRRRSETDPDARWTHITMDDFCRRYAKAARLATRYATEQPESFRIVHYERFTRSPAQTYAEICDFVGERFVDEAVAQPPGEYGDWAPDPHLFGSIVDRSGDWRSLLGPDEASELEDRLSGPMTSLGYDRYTRGPSTRSV